VSATAKRCTKAAEYGGVAILKIDKSCSGIQGVARPSFRYTVISVCRSSRQPARNRDIKNDIPRAGLIGIFVPFIGKVDGFTIYKLASDGAES